MRLQDGLLQAPVSGSVSGVQLSGQVEVDGAAEVPRFALHLGTAADRSRRPGRVAVRVPRHRRTDGALLGRGECAGRPRRRAGALPGCAAEHGAQQADLRQRRRRAPGRVHPGDPRGPDAAWAGAHGAAARHAAGRGLRGRPPRRGPGDDGERSARPAQAHRHRTGRDADGRTARLRHLASRPDRTSRFACLRAAPAISAAGWAWRRPRPGRC